MKLEKIEIGGIKGKMLSAQGVLIHEEFQEYYAHFATQVNKKDRASLRRMIILTVNLNFSGKLLNTVCPTATQV